LWPASRTGTPKKKQQDMVSRFNCSSNCLYSTLRFHTDRVIMYWMIVARDVQR
jgi:hypothetical protein